MEDDVDVELFRQIEKDYFKIARAAAMSVLETHKSNGLEPLMAATIAFTFGIAAGRSNMSFPELVKKKLELGEKLMEGTILEAMGVEYTAKIMADYVDEFENEHAAVMVKFLERYREWGEVDTYIGLFLSGVYYQHLKDKDNTHLFDESPKDIPESEK